MSNQKRSFRILLTNGPVRHCYEALPSKVQERSPSMEAAIYYGFIPVRNLTPSNLDRSAIRATSSIDNIFGNPANDKKCFSPTESATLIKLYKNGHFSDLPGSIMLYREKSNRSKRAGKETVSHKCGFDIIGVSGSIAEALTIQASYAVLEEEGFNDLEIEINSIGDKQSREAFERDITLYVRSIINKLPENIKELCKKNSYALFSSTEEEIESFIEDAPKPISYLSEESRNHLKETLEYLEELEMPYSINHRLIAHKALHGHTIFRIVPSNPNFKNGGELVSAYGMRYNPLSRRLGYQKSTPAVCSYLVYKKMNKSKKRLSRKPASPEFCFVHLGTAAKQKSLRVIDTLRKNRIPICHYLTKDKLAGQMNTLEKLKMPYLVIMGHKEALEGTVMIRDMADHSQETIPLEELLPYLKRIRSKKIRSEKTNTRPIKTKKRLSVES